MDVAAAVQQQTEFTLDLFKAVAGGSAKDAGNTAMSPISIATALAMAGAGAKGKTLEEITTHLKLPEGEIMHEFVSQLCQGVLKDGSDVGGPILSLVNGLWVEKSLTLKPQFTEVVKGRYGAQAKEADFGNKAEEERTAINSWVLEETKGKIADLLPPDSVHTKTSLVLANALYFRGQWTKPFDTDLTTEKDFYLLDGTTVKVPFMSALKRQYVACYDTYKVLKLPYSQGQDQRSFSMFIVLPNERDGLPEVEKNLDAQTLTTHFSRTNKQVEVSRFLLPKFKVTTGFEVSATLSSLGLKLPFSNEADFTDMVEGPNAALLCLSDVFHKCFIEVNESGTEAAAATAVTMTLKSLMFPIAPPVEFVADHPFLFVLKENITGVILFIGRITNPSLSG